MNNNKGMTLVEVMVAASIGTAMFLFFNMQMSKMAKWQKKMERKNNITFIKDDVRKYLSNFQAWEANPESEIPIPSNDVNFYFFRNSRTKLKQLSILGNDDILSKIENLDLNCPKDNPNCRIIFFDYRGKLYNEEEELFKLSKNHFKVIINFITPEDEITRAFIPELSAQIIDTNRDKEIKVNPQLFYINTTKSNTANNEYPFDVVARGKCIKLFINKFPNKSELAAHACSKAKSLMPYTCFMSATKDLRLSDLSALALCANAVNNIPIKCYQQAQQKLSITPLDTALLCSEARSLDPIRCMERLETLSIPDTLEKMGPKICSRSIDDGPAICMAEIATLHKKNWKHALFMCPYHK